MGRSSEGEPALPSFGSVVFTLGSSKDSEGINAHISVLFTKAPEGNGSGTPPGMVEPPTEGIGKESPVLQPPIEVGTSGKEILHAPSHPQEQEPQGTTKNKWAAMWEGIPEGQGWCTIVEEKGLGDEGLVDD